MHIEKLVIFGFGQHENVTIPFKDGINVLYGRNEAGKTTIQQFLLSVLFGFPLRNHANLRYEPKGGGRYGGQVHLQHAELGKVIIERVKGKSAGDVTVYFEDGTRGQEEALKKVLYRYDRTSFESIFSFSIHQLQNFDKMTEDELSRTLLASGTTGVDALTKLEQRATKDMNALFKKSGRNPEMNVKIDEIRNLDQTIKEARQKIDQYEPSIVRMAEIDSQLESLKLEEQRLHLQNEQLAKYRQAKPLLEQKIQLEQKMSVILQPTFPAEGIRRYEVLKDRVQHLRIQTDQLQQAISNQQQFSFDASSNIQVKEFEELLAKESEWHHWQLREQQLKSDLEQTKRDIQQQARMLGIKDEEHLSHIKEMDVSLQKEEYFQLVLQRLHQADEVIRFEMQNYERLQLETEEIERKIELLNQSIPSNEDRQQSGNMQKLSGHLAELKARQHLGNQPAMQNNNTAPIVSAIIGIASLIGAFILGNWMVAVGGFALAGLVYMFLMKMNQSNSVVNSTDYSAEIMRLEQELSKAEHVTMQIRLHDEQMKQLHEQRQDKHRLKMKIDQQMNIAQEKREEAHNELSKFLRSHGFAELLHPQLFPELFKRIRHIQEQQQISSQITVELNAVTDHIQERLVKISEAIGGSLSKEHAYHQLKEAYSTMKESQREQILVQEKIKEWSVQLEEKQELLDVHSNDIRKLWGEAQVNTEAAFYEADVAYRMKQSLEMDLQSIHAQLHSIGDIPHAIAQEEELSLQMSELQEQANNLAISRNALLEEKAWLKQKTNTMLSDEQYGYSLQQFELKKTELAHLAHKWSVNKAVIEAIRQTMHHLKENRLPFVLEKAKEFFSHLTNGRYESLEMNEDGVFEAIGSHGMRFGIAELSQATKEQAYIAMRFALAESLITSVPFPIMMDDPFVHFDRFRIQQMVQLMTDLEKHHQFLYFTCDEEMTTTWPHAHVIDVASLQKKRSVQSI